MSPERERLVRVREIIDELAVLLRMSDGKPSAEGQKILDTLERWYADGAPPHPEEGQ